MLEKMGWKKEVPAAAAAAATAAAAAAAAALVCPRSLILQDGGLGASVRGLAEPILVNIKRTREGLGCASETPVAAACAASSASSEAMLHVILFVTLTCVILRNQDLILPYLR